MNGMVLSSDNWKSIMICALLSCQDVLNTPMNFVIGNESALHTYKTRYYEPSSALNRGIHSDV